MGMTPAMYKVISSFFRKKDKDILEFGSQQLSHVFDDENKTLFLKEYGIRDGDFTKVLYEHQGYNYDSIDIEAGTIFCDLNDGLPVLSKQYDIVTNLGTTEHIFNQHVAFCAIHGATKVGGRIFHFLPMNHSPHGLFNYNIDFFLSLCYANRYKIIDLKKAIIEESSDYSFRNVSDCDVSKVTYLFLVVEKTSNSDFCPAQQIEYLPKISIPMLDLVMGDFFDEVAERIISHGQVINKKIIDHILMFERAIVKHGCKSVSLYCANDISFFIQKNSDCSGLIERIYDGDVQKINNEFVFQLPDVFLEKIYIYIASDRFFDEIKNELLSRKDANNIIVIN